LPYYCATSTERETANTMPSVAETCRIWQPEIYMPDSQLRGRKKKKEKKKNWYPRNMTLKTCSVNVT